LRGALQDHVKRRFEEFAAHLIAQAEALPGRTLSEVRVQVERASTDIRAAAEATIAGQKEVFEGLATLLATEIASASTDVTALLADVGEATDAERLGEVKSRDDELGEAVTSEDSLTGIITESRTANARAAESEQDPLSAIRCRATKCVKRYVLRDGDSGWSIASIFRRDYLDGATQAWLVDPYLAKRFQRRNLTEFVLALLSAAKLKTLHVITRERNETTPDSDHTYYNGLDRDAFEKTGTRILFAIDEQIHDRFFVLDNGIVFKLGRGLDIYKPTSALGSRDAALRKVRGCEIDVFAPE
jgi:hypothetical protein